MRTGDSPVPFEATRLLPDTIVPTAMLLNTTLGTVVGVFSGDLVDKAQVDPGLSAWDGTDRWDSTSVGIASNIVTWSVSNAGPDAHAVVADYDNASGILEGLAGESVPNISDFPLAVVP